MIKKILAIMFLLLPLWCLAWPTKDITIIVPYGPGGASDFLARNYRTDLERMFNVRVEIKYLPGASTMVAVNHMLSTDNDNHTFMVTADDFVTGTWANGNKLYEKFTPVVILGSLPYVVFGGINSESDRFKQQVKQGQLVNIANLGVNSATDLWMLNLKSSLKINTIPYKSSSSLLTDIMGGHVEYAAMSLYTVNTQLSDKKIVPIMISTDTRSSHLPNTPSFRELGFQGESWTAWWGVVVRRDTSPDAVTAMNLALREIISKNFKIQDMSKQGLRILNLSQKESEKYLEAELFKIQKIPKPTYGPQ